jgi:hypothetical protein
MSSIKRIILVLAVVVLGIPFTADAQVWVNGYYRDDGTYVKGHYRSSPDGNPYNNYSFPGNYNPNTGEVTSGSVEAYLRNYYEDSDGESGGPVWVEGYYRDNGTYVEGHWRTAPDGDPTNNYSYPIIYNSNTGKTTVASSSRDSFYILTVQRALEVLGYNPGPIDGLWGPKTRSAIRSFQRIQNLEVDGIPGEKTLQRIQSALYTQRNSPAAPTNYDTSKFAGEWNGDYTCGQGRTGLTLSLEVSQTDGIQGTFKFYSVESNPGVPSGSYRVSGNLNQHGYLILRGVQWIKRPSEYIMVDVTGVLGPRENTLGGKICGNPFLLLKGEI